MDVNFELDQIVLGKSCKDSGIIGMSVVVLDSVDFCWLGWSASSIKAVNFTSAPTFVEIIEIF